ncbi:MAG: heparinase II/III family protein [Clostridia bacterium]|nr:heparinase II/III family protein [Clostridia bacterium]
MDISFVMNRLMRMSAPEIGYRIKQKAQNTIEKRKVPSYKFDTSILEHKCSLFRNQLCINNIYELINKADSLCENKMDIFALTDFYVGNNINYHKDYKSGLTAPSDVFGKTIDYRKSSEIGDIKYIWEPNRHLFLLPLALSYKLSGVEKYLEKFEYYLSEWLAQNPFPYGVNWASSLELGIRLINWTLCWHLVGEAIDRQIYRRWMESIYRHCWFIERNFSAYSSANNHLIGEAAGLFVASAGLPAFKLSGRWRSKAYKILVQECEKQNYSDGVNKEQAISYQQFVFDFLVIAALVGEANGVGFPEAYWSRLEKMLEYVAAIEDLYGNVPQIGDEDDGFVIDIGQKEYGVYRSVLNTGACLFKRYDFIRKDRDEDNKTKLLLDIIGPRTEGSATGDMGEASLNREKRKTIAKQGDGKNVLVEAHRETECRTYTDEGRTRGLRTKFDEGGYYILGADFGTPREQKMVFDCGPLGYLSLAAHGHADALSFHFSAGGCPIFVDPGTYAYHANKKWRNYFRSTAAHNTVCVDEKDQSVIAGNFMWSHKAEAQLQKYIELTNVKGTHNGYMRLKDGVSHTREINFDMALKRWDIADELICRGEHHIALHFHTYPGCKVKADNNVIQVHFGKGICFVYFEHDLQFSLHEGDENIPLGWYSSSYDRKVAAKTIRLQKKISGNNKIVTSFEVQFL